MCVCTVCVCGRTCVEVYITASFAFAPAVGAVASIFGPRFTLRSRIMPFFHNASYVISLVFIQAGNLFFYCTRLRVFILRSSESCRLIVIVSLCRMINSAFTFMNGSSTFCLVNILYIVN